jgi:hypothetical protein
MAPPFLISALGGEWSASRPGRFTPSKRAPRYTLDWRLGGLQSRSGRCGVKKNVLSLRVSNPGRKARSNTD